MYPTATAIGATVNGGGVEKVYSGGVATGTVLQLGGQIDVSCLGFAAGGTASLNAATDLLTVTETTGSYTQQLSGSYAGKGFLVASDGTGGTLVTVVCYATGTHLATPSGETPVQALCAGDEVLALQDGAWTVARGCCCARCWPAPPTAAPTGRFFDKAA